MRRYVHLFVSVSQVAAYVPGTGLDRRVQAAGGSRCGTKGGQGLDHTNLGTMVRTSGFVLNAMRGP